MNYAKVREAQDFYKPLDVKWRDKALSYLESRGFGHYHILRYKLKFATTGRYKYRIIIPIFYKGKLVNYTTRDFLNRKGESRYENAPLNAVITNSSDMLYGVDNFDGTKMRLLEGPFDVMAIGNTSVALMRSKISPAQATMIYKLGVTELSIVLDSDAFWRGLIIAEELEPFVSMIKVIKLEGKEDAAELGLKKIEEMESKTPLFMA